MSNINDYLKWRGDIPMDDRFPFNEIDSMILSRLSYLRFDKIKMEDQETIENASKKMENLDDDDFLYNGDKELIKRLGESSRFKDMVLTDYVKIDNIKYEKQFGAITVHISDKEIYISYLGTDKTINGWKEDFNMAFMKIVPCQIEGKKYLEKISHRYKNMKIRIGGHSKGGNIAIYSILTINKDVQDRIIKVYNYDGQGLNKEIYIEKDNSILTKAETYLPQDSIIGRILEHKEKETIVLSNEKGIFQHDIYSWQVEGTKLIKVESNSKSSERVNKVLTTWLETTSEEQREIFVDTVFEVINSTEKNTFADISKNLYASARKILKKYKEISKEDKKIVINMLILFAKIYFSNFKEQGEEKINIIKEKLLSENK